MAYSTEDTLGHQKEIEIVRPVFPKHGGEIMAHKGPIAGSHSARRRWHGDKLTQPLPRGATGSVRMPADLKALPEAAGFWRRLAPMLIDDGRLTPDRIDAFATMARLHATRVELRGLLAQQGYTVVTKDGTTANPVARLLRNAETDWLAIARDFGLTPGAAARLPISEQHSADEDPLAKFGV